MLTPPSHELVQRIKRTSLPSRLYHYTSQAGCIGIFHSRSIWATSIRFFNDEKEFVLAHDIAYEYLTELEMTSSYEESGFFHALREDFSIGASETYVASFSTQSDLLSQWRGYAASGYSLGLSTSQLVGAAGADVLLAPCVYDETQQVALIHQAADAAANYFRDLCNAGEAEGTAARMAIEDFQVALGILAPVIKHAAFVEE